MTHGKTAWIGFLYYSLDDLILLNEVHLRRVLNEFALHYNTARPHHGLDQRLPIALPRVKLAAEIHCRDRLGDILNEFFATLLEFLSVEISPPYRHLCRVDVFAV